jgi:hypothetical protein
MAFQFLNAASDDPQQVLIAAAEAANTHFLITAAIMVVALVVALSAARALLVGLNIANPLRLLRGPLILAGLGALLTLALNLPGVFLILVAGLAWAAYRIFDECFNPVERRPRLRRADAGGDLADWS